MTHTTHAHHNSNGRHEKVDSDPSYSMRAYRKRKFWIALSWIALSMMLVAMFVYLATGDLSIQPDSTNQLRVGQPTP